MGTTHTGEDAIRTCENRPAVFRDVILYVLNKVGDLPETGETVLHKLLYFIDFDFYEKHEESLMGETYIKNMFGPTSVNLEKELKRMEDLGIIHREEREYRGHTQRRASVLQRPVFTDLIELHIDHIDGVLEKHSGKSAREFTKYSHGDIPWLCADDEQPISYESVFYRDEEYSVKEFVDDL